MLVRILATAMLSIVLAATPEAAPPGDLASLGLPELSVTVNDSTITGLPATLEANRYLVHVTAEGSGLAGVEFARPEGMSIDDFVAALAVLHGGHMHGGASHDTGAGQAREHGDDHGTPAAAAGMPGMDMGDSPVYNATFAGGIVVAPGQTADVVVDLSAGEWVVTGGPDAPQEPVTLTVSGEMPATLPEPDADATLTMGEYVIQLTEGTLASGPQLVKVENIGAQPHFIDISRSSVDVTRDQVLAAVGADGMATPMSGGFDANADLQRVMSTTTQSHGVTTWVTVDLPPGTYVLQCHFPDIQDGRTHAAHGMVNVVTIGN